MFKIILVCLLIIQLTNCQSCNYNGCGENSQCCGTTNIYDGICISASFNCCGNLNGYSYWCQSGTCNGFISCNDGTQQVQQQNPSSQQQTQNISLPTSPSTNSGSSNPTTSGGDSSSTSGGDSTPTGTTSSTTGQNGASTNSGGDNSPSTNSAGDNNPSTNSGSNSGSSSSSNNFCSKCYFTIFLFISTLFLIFII